MYLSFNQNYYLLLIYMTCYLDSLYMFDNYMYVYNGINEYMYLSFNRNY